MALQITIIICGTVVIVALLGRAVQLVDSVLHFVGFLLDQKKPRDE